MWGKCGLAVLTLLAWLPVLAPGVAGADVHRAPANPAGIVESDECGRVAGLSGKVEIRHGFMPEKDAPGEVGLADRLRSGDELLVLAGGRLEWKTGRNTIVTAGPGARIRLEGVRNISDPGGGVSSRLEFRLIEGEARIQVRLNQSRPEGVLAHLPGAEFLLSRGDLALAVSGGWRGSVLEGGAEWRLRNGAPFLPLAAGVTADASGEAVLPPAGALAVRDRLPFSFELTRLALPPNPPSGEDGESGGP